MHCVDAAEEFEREADRIEGEVERESLEGQACREGGGVVENELVLVVQESMCANSEELLHGSSGEVKSQLVRENSEEVRRRSGNASELTRCRFGSCWEPSSLEVQTDIWGEAPDGVEIEHAERAEVEAELESLAAREPL